jgi:ppGpp synthetase/RelA/SpoT-type nucleotidyltranferase
MITPTAIRNKYISLERYLTRLRTMVRDTLQPFVDRNGYAIVSRIKSLESLTEKLESGRYKGWAELDDLVAFTVVVPTLSDEATALNFLSSVFETVSLKARGATNKAPDVFRFDGTRFIARLTPSGTPGRENLEAITFEVQIRSAFEHA